MIQASYHDRRLKRVDPVYDYMRDSVFRIKGVDTPVFCIRIHGGLRISASVLYMAAIWPDPDAV